MKTNIATTREQSDRLLKCGVPAESADMCLSTRTRRSDGSFIAKKHQTTNLWIGYPCWRTTSGDEELDNVPAWSLSALLQLLPKGINADGITYKLNIDYPPIGQVAIRYNTEDDDLDSLFGLMDENLFELIVRMAEKLAANGYKLNGIEKGGEND